MTYPEFSIVVRSVVERLMETKSEAEIIQQIDNPTFLSVNLGIEIKSDLVDMGVDHVNLHNHLLDQPYFHLENVFDATVLENTPKAFIPVPQTVSTIAGRIGSLAIHGFLNLETISYKSENDGHLFVNIVVIPGYGKVPEKSQKDMRGHTDGVTFPFSGDDDSEYPRIAPAPDLVTLVGLRNPDSVPTNIMPLSTVLTHLSQVEIDELKKDQFSITSQTTFTEGMKKIFGEELTLIDEPILKDRNDKTCIRFSHSNIIVTENTQQAINATDSLKSACINSIVPVVIKPGDICVINNRQSLHGRAQVGGEAGGQSRWLLRTYAIDSTNLAEEKRHGDGEPSHVLYP